MLLEKMIDMPTTARIIPFIQNRTVEAMDELDLLIKLIKVTEKAVSMQCKEIDGLLFTNSWVDHLRHFVLDEKGHLLPDWEERTKIWVGSFRYNDALIDPNSNAALSYPDKG